MTFSFLGNTSTTRNFPGIFLALADILLDMIEWNEVV